MTSLLRSLMVTIAGSCAVVASAQMNPAPVVTLKVSTLSVAAGKPIQAVLTVKFADGLHGYQNPPSDPSLIPVSVKSGDKAFSVVTINYPKGTPTKVGGMDKPVNLYQGTIQIPVILKAPTKLGKASLKLTFSYQQCNESACFPPGSVSVDGSVTVVKKVSTGKPAKGKA